MRVIRYTIIVLLGLVLVGCGATATPVAVFEEAVVPTRQPTPTPPPPAAPQGLGFVFPAEDGGTLTLSSDVTGFIDSENYAQIYTFEGLAGQRIDVSMSGGGMLDTYLILIGPDGREITRNDDRSPNSRDAQLRSVSLEDNGIYTLVATVWRQRYTAQSGEYRLELDEAQPTDAPPSPRTKFISYGVTQFESLSDRNFWDAYTFQGEAGDIIEITMFAANGFEPDASLVLTDSYGNEIAQNEDINPLDTTDAAIFGFILPYSGYYTAVATRYGGKAGTTSGDYELTVDFFEHVDPTGLGYGYRDANQSVSLLDAPNMGLRDFGYYVGDTFEFDLNDNELTDVPIQTVLTYYLPPLEGRLDTAFLNLSDCDTAGAGFDAIGGIEVLLDEIDGRINLETAFAPSDDAELVTTMTDCVMVDVTGIVREQYTDGETRLQFRLVPQANAENETDDLVVFLAPRLEINFTP